MFTDNESSTSEDTEADYNDDTFEVMTELMIPVILNIFHPTQTYSPPPPGMKNTTQKHNIGNQ